MRRVVAALLTGLDRRGHWGARRHRSSGGLCAAACHRALGAHRGRARLARLGHFAARLQIQEELVKQIGQYIVDKTAPRGLAVRISAVHISAVHMCKTHRGARHGEGVGLLENGVGMHPAWVTQANEPPVGAGAHQGASR